MKMKNSIKKIITLLITLVIFVSVLELIGSTLIDKESHDEMTKALQESRYELSKDPIILFELGPKSYKRSGSVDVNSYGMVDYEYSILKPKDTMRIVVVGDSITEGMGVNFNDTYAKVLEKKLNEDGIKTEVLNFGISRYSTIQEIQVLKRKALLFEPDIIVLGYFLNDPIFEDPFINYLKELTNYETDKKTFELIDAPQECWNRLKIKKIIDQSKFLTALTTKERNVNYTSFYKQIHEDPCTWKTVDYSFRQLSSISIQKNIPIIITIFPVLEFNNYPFLEIHKQVRDEAEKYKFVVIDLYDEFFATGKSLRTEPGDNIHPNKQGHKIAAERIYEKVLVLIQ